jgi:hypothetical protein
VISEEAWHKVSHGFREATEEKKEEKIFSLTVRGRRLTASESHVEQMQNKTFIDLLLKRQDKGSILKGKDGDVRGLARLFCPAGNCLPRRLSQQGTLRFLEEIRRKKIKGLRRKIS